MRYTIDHLAFRTFNREKAVEFFKALGYKEQETFTLYFNDEKTETAICTALEPSDRVSPNVPFLSFEPFMEDNVVKGLQKYVLSPEIFVSEGNPGSIVHEWCTKKGGANLHHIALRISDESTVEEEMKLWLDNGWCEGFSSDAVVKCDDMSQIFTKTSQATGIIWELIQRKEKGFCKDAVVRLMKSTKGD